MLRENILCNADLTPIVWRWNERWNFTEVRFDVVHTCKSWDPIQEWAEEVTNTVKFNKKVHVVDDLQFPDGA